MARPDWFSGTMNCGLNIFYSSLLLLQLTTGCFTTDPGTGAGCNNGKWTIFTVHNLTDCSKRTMKASIHPFTHTFLHWWQRLPCKSFTQTHTNGKAIGNDLAFSIFLKDTPTYRGWGSTHRPSD